MIVWEVHFRCNGCGALWSEALENPLRSPTELKAYLDTHPQECPLKCGAQRADVMFKLTKPATPDAEGA
jgi:hypothetical protein